MYICSAKSLRFSVKSFGNINKITNFFNIKFATATQSKYIKENIG